MATGRVEAIFIAPEAGAPMQHLQEVKAFAGEGLKGDRYSIGEGSWNRDRKGKRQVTLINAAFFPGSGFEFSDSRRNIITSGIELMVLIGRTFWIGDVQFRGVKYCEPCERPSKLAGVSASFDEVFHDRGGLIAEILNDGIIQTGDVISLIE